MEALKFLQDVLQASIVVANALAGVWVATLVLLKLSDAVLSDVVPDRLANYTVAKALGPDQSPLVVEHLLVTVSLVFYKDLRRVFDEIVNPGPRALV